MRDEQRGLDYHLSALSRTTSNYVVPDAREGGKYSYELNVCRKLVDVPGVHCGPFAGACQAIANATSHSLGQPAGPVIAADGAVELRYDHGEPCGQNARSTVIRFECDEEDGALVRPRHFMVYRDDVMRVLFVCVLGRAKL